MISYSSSLRNFGFLNIKVGLPHLPIPFYYRLGYLSIGCGENVDFSWASVWRDAVSGPRILKKYLKKRGYGKTNTAHEQIERHDNCYRAETNKMFDVAMIYGVLELHWMRNNEPSVLEQASGPGLPQGLLKHPTKNGPQRIVVSIEETDLSAR
ncbi:hypothetical protein NPIL_479041 [Nephila pilipes]|uniref:Uncharacterized protein n=1 Tax=Nephila pilipes TaxID=299642 RepID=A0A8X6N254_NEPPI|nr:hypothetical protein NPIL_479041 [Nephila pilipes]